MAKKAALTAEQRQTYESLRASGKAGAYKDAILNGNTKRAEELAKTVPATPATDTGTGDTGTGDTGTGDTTKTDPVAEKVGYQLADAQKYGDEFANKYITDASFGHINADTTPEMQAFLAALKGRMDTAGNYTGLENEALSESRKGLAGYASPEMQAFREQAQAEINRDYQNRQHENMVNAARFGIRGPAATTQMQDAATDNTMARGNLERDLFVKNADYMERARNAFGSLVNQTEQARFGRQDAADKNYGGALSGEEAARTGRQIFNTNQDTNKDITKSGLALSGAGLYAGQYGGQQSIDLATKQAQDNLEWQKTMQEQNRKDMQKWFDMQNRSLNSTSSNI